ncbi:MAG: tetratricopeptide repeat protein, partial [Candidatus Wallbacteria bacterium]|nr:tetratricopeptide repeat protein [Candidatus Wallbacteria bacterium]
MELFQCPFMAMNDKEGNIPKGCLHEKCSFYDLSRTDCVFSLIGKASTEYLKNIESANLERELSNLRQESENYLLNEKREKAQIFLSQAEKYFSKNIFETALSEYRKAQTMDERNLQALTGIADCYSRMKRHDLSIEYYKRILTTVPDNPEIADRMLCEYGQLYREYSQRHEVYKQIIEKFKNSLSKEPDNFMSNYSLGLSFYYFTPEADKEIMVSSMQEAEKYLKKAIQISPDKQYPHFSLIKVLMKEYEIGKNTLQEALNIAKKAVKLVPTYYPGYYELARVYSLIKTEESGSEAIKQMIIAIKLSEGHGEYSAFLGDLYWDKCLYHKALEAYEKALELNYLNHRMLLKLSKIYDFNFMYGKALHSLKSALDYKFCPEVLEDTSILCLKLGDFDEAVKNLLNSLEHFPDYEAAYPRFFELLSREQMSEKRVRILADLSKRAKTNPASLFSLLFHGYQSMYLDADREKGLSAAAASFHRAITVYPESPSGYLGLARSAKTQGDLLDAIDNLKKFLQIDPQNSAVYENLADLYLKNEDADNARKHYEKLLEQNPRYPVFPKLYDVYL